MAVQSDQAFFKTFGVVLVGLVIFTIAIIVLALVLHGQRQVSEVPSREAAREARFASVAEVYAGETGRAAAAAAAAAATAAATPQLAFDGTLDGGVIYRGACGTCHDGGIAGAPAMVASDWVGRLDKGLETLVANAINGIGAMPARGGYRNLSDEQVQVSVTYMLDMLE